nr:MAG TPA: hypothetical protein [Caudoviricetes sp.]
MTNRHTPPLGVVCALGCAPSRGRLMPLRRTRLLSELLTGAPR